MGIFDKSKYASREEVRRILRNAKASEIFPGAPNRQLTLAEQKELEDKIFGDSSKTHIHESEFRRLLEKERREIYKPGTWGEKMRAKKELEFLEKLATPTQNPPKQGQSSNK